MADWDELSVASQLNTALHILYVCLIYTTDLNQLVSRKLQDQTCSIR